VDITGRLQDIGVYAIQGWTTQAVDVVVDPLTGVTEKVPSITTPTGPLRLVYVSRPYGWVVVYEISQ
jgi:dolichyl-diphosphooligosaccharide--protein glycosyltransferase